MNFRCEACANFRCRCYEIEIIRAARHGVMYRQGAIWQEMKKSPQAVLTPKSGKRTA